MATTTNYGWTTPDDTDLVKDGAAAIRTLGSSVDTTTKALNPSTTEGDIEYRSATANTNARLAIGTAGQVLTVNSGEDAPEWAALPASASGLNLISTTTIGSAVSSVTVSDAFSATYDNYRVIVSGGGASTNNTLNLTLGATSTGYSRVLLSLTFGSTSLAGFTNENTSSITSVALGQTTDLVGCFDLFMPFAAKRTTLNTTAFRPAAGGACNILLGYVDNTTSYTAFTLTTSTGTITGGTIRVYGYQNS